jgi:hypothetical protein
VGADRADRGGGPVRGAAGRGLELFAQKTRVAGTDWALGIEARCRALLSQSAAEADSLYREAIERLGRTRVRVELDIQQARHHLAQGTPANAARESACRPGGVASGLLTRGPGDLHHERGKLQALPIATPIDSTITPPSVTTSSEERSETCRNLCLTQAIATSSIATTIPATTSAWLTLVMMKGRE